ncbi:MAG: GGDEF domain-containing protein [Oscillospiraceae bacterium]|nr:GGDEF domain-containing protein [Oscillospiraceae bacterium]
MIETDIAERGREEGPGGIRLGRFHAAVGVAFAVLAVLMLISTWLTGRGYSRLEDATERYITAQQAAADMQAASDYLTAESRGFIATGEIARAAHFYEEVEVTRRRDNALESIGTILESPEAYAYLDTALANSNELEKIEEYAMRLAAESYGCKAEELPEALRAVELEAADLRLSAEEQRDKALMMVFDGNYQSHKDTIKENVSRSMETLIEETRSDQTASSARLIRQMQLENVLIVAMLILALLLILATARLVTKPLKSFIENIGQDKALPEEGASELRFLARTYNQVREQNLQHREQLSYDAMHDALTGLFNRSVFEKLRSRFEERDNALLIFDLDRFKQINDTYGHDAGDRALRRVAALLQENFRAEDYVCRIGGDEFVVIMVHVNSSLRDLVENKISRINELLQTPLDGLPPITLSVGVAFGDRENPTGDAYKDADAALYRTKSVRLGGCEFY